MQRTPCIPTCCELTAERQKQLLDSVDTFLFDCDGVLWTGKSDIIPRAREVVQFLRSEGKSVYFVSNNGSKSTDEYHQKFVKLGFQVQKEEVFCVSYVAAHYLRHVLDIQRKVYLIGMPGFGRELDLMGVSYIGGEVELTNSDVSTYLDIQLDPEVDAVVIGVDFHLSYTKLVKALSYLKNPACHFVATDEDAFLPTTSNIVIPGSGCVLGGLIRSSGRLPTAVGKPHKAMFDVITKCTNLNPHRTVMIGDRLMSDIKFGKNHGMKTLLVLSGATKKSALSAVAPDVCPDLFCDSVANLLPL